jgi:nucleoside 2-deoxyribosyltransferase
MPLDSQSAQLEARHPFAISTQLRVNIRRSRFLVCDLTHGNRGAYWESGFAEGLGKPAIYTCRKDVFEDSAELTAHKPMQTTRPDLHPATEVGWTTGLEPATAGITIRGSTS